MLTQYVVKERVNIYANKSVKSGINIPCAETVSKTEWAVVLLISLIAFFAFREGDLNTLAVWSLNLLDCIADGDIFNIYAYSAQNIQGVTHQYIGGDIQAFFFYALWNLPIWIIQRFFGVLVMESVFLVLWFKLLLVVSLFITAVYAYKLSIKLELGEYRARIAAYLTFSSVYALACVFLAGQTCVIVVMFSVVAIYELLNKRVNRFILFSMLAVTIKPYYLFALIAALLITEKRITHIIRAVVICFLPMLFIRLLFMGAPMYYESISGNIPELQFSFYFRAGIESQFGMVSFLLMALCVIYYLCYSKTFETQKEQNYFLIYAVTFCYLVMNVFAFDMFYRFIYLVPFLYILILMNKRTQKTGLLVSAAMSFLVLIFFSAEATDLTNPMYLFGTYNMRGTVFELIYPAGTQSISYIGQMIYSVLPYEFFPIIPALTMFCALWLLIALYPGLKVSVPYENEEPAKWIIRINAYQAAVPVLLSLFLFFFK